MNLDRTVLAHADFKVEELQQRWQKARLFVLKSVVPTATAKGSDELSELDLLKLVPTEKRDAVLKSIFDNSRKLGLSLTKYLGLTWELTDLAEILPQLKLGCFLGKWTEKNSARVLERAGACDSLMIAGSFGCDYWREALDGFVMGVGENERYTRHRSQGHHDDHCLDILFTESYEIPRIVNTEENQQSTSLKFGLISTEIKEKLSPLVSRLLGMKIDVDLKGLSEGVLYYELNPHDGVLCGAGGKLIHESFAKEAAAILPGIQVKDVAPLAVYGGSS